MVCGVFASRSTTICIRSSLRRRRRQQSPWRLGSCPNGAPYFQKSLQERKGSRPATASRARTTRNSSCRTGRGRGRIGLAVEVMETACPQAVGESPRLPNQIKDRTAVWPFLPFLNQSRPQRILLDVPPFLPIIFSRPKIAIKIVRLPNRWGKVQGGPELARADALPHLHPVRHWPRDSCTTCKEMNVIGHQNVMTNPPAVAFRRSFPQAPQNDVTLAAS